MSPGSGQDSGKGVVNKRDDLQQAAAKSAASAYAVAEAVLKLRAVGNDELPLHMGLGQGDGALRLVFELQ